MNTSIFFIFAWSKKKILLVSTSTKKNRQREHARFGACFFIHSKSTLSLWMSLALAWLSLGTLNHKRIRRANFLSLIVEHSENVVWKVRCRLLLDTSVTRNGDLLPSWRFWHPLGQVMSAKLAWRLAIFWQISKILVAILAILNFIGILCKNLLHKKYFDTSWTQFLFAFFSFSAFFSLFAVFSFSASFSLFSSNSRKIRIQRHQSCVCCALPILTKKVLHSFRKIQGFKHQKKSEPNLAWISLWTLGISSAYFLGGTPTRGGIILKKLKILKTFPHCCEKNNLIIQIQII